jgi:hypothetical protein
MVRPYRVKSLTERVEDLEEDVHGDPLDPADDGLVGAVRFLREREIARDGVLKAIRIAGLLLGIAVALLTLVQVLHHTAGT